MVRNVHSYSCCRAGRKFAYGRNIDFTRVLEDYMSLCQLGQVKRLLAAGVVLALALVVARTPALAQSEQKDNPPKVEIFGGYQWYNPGATVPDFTGTGVKLNSAPKGWGTAVTWNFNKYFGLTGDFGGNYEHNNNYHTLSVGPRFMWRGDGLNIFAQTLLSLHRFSETGVDTRNGIGAVLGGGVDLPVSRKISLRLLEADYVWARQNFTDANLTNDPALRRPSFSGARLRSGVVFNLGGAPEVPPSASCSASPTEVMTGDPVTVTINTNNFKPGHAITYNYTATGGKVTGKDNTASVDTTGLTAGSYTVSARATDAKMKKGGEAGCNASFAVKEPPKNPPTMSCSANPTTVQTGTPSTITCECKSPDGVPVTISNWSASNGKLSGSGNTATLDTTGASAGTSSISATCTDSRGLTASASTSVNVENPPPPPPQASKLSECAFPNPKKPWRVDNTCKAVLDDVALRMQKDADARLEIVGFADDTELKKRKNLAGERAVNSKAYLAGGEAKQGIDPTRIGTRTGTGGGQKAEYWVVPAGATYDSAGTTAVDEAKVPAVPDHPKPAAKKKAR
jgi:hypothetical protein